MLTRVGPTGKWTVAPPTSRRRRPTSVLWRWNTSSASISLVRTSTFVCFKVFKRFAHRRCTRRHNRGDLQQSEAAHLVAIRTSYLGTIEGISMTGCHILDVTAACQSAACVTQSISLINKLSQNSFYLKSNLFWLFFSLFLHRQLSHQTKRKTF